MAEQTGADQPQEIAEAMLLFNQLLAQVQPVELVYKLYYDAEGRVVTYTTQPQAGNYIEITREQFAEARPDVLVVDGRIVTTHTVTVANKLVEVQNMPALAASSWDINIIVDTAQDGDFKLWRLKSHDL